MNKNTIYALLLAGTASTLGCVPTETEANKGKILSIPAECHEIITLIRESHSGWNLTCKNNEGKEVYYDLSWTEDKWTKYDIVRE